MGLHPKTVEKFIMMFQNSDITQTALEALVDSGVTQAELESLNNADSAVITKEISLSAAAGSEQDTGWDLPTKAKVLDCYVDVTTKEDTGTTKTINVGTDGSDSNDPNGFASGLDVSSTGIKRPEATVTSGGTETYFSANTRGALLASFQAGTDAANDFGLNHETPYFHDSGTDSVTWTPASNFSEFAGTLVIEYIDLT